MESISISIIIHVYNSEKTLKELYSRLVTTVEKEKTKFEIIFVEDCGTDKSWEIISQLVILDERVKGIQLSRNEPRSPCNGDDPDL